MRRRSGEAEVTRGAVVWAAGTSFINPHTVIRAGEVWAADDPLVRARPDMFEADPYRLPGLVRRSTPAAPPDAQELWEAGVAADAAAQLLGEDRA